MEIGAKRREHGFARIKLDEPGRPSALQRGFTLIEVMIVVAIIAILAAVALPSYRDYILRGKVSIAPVLLSTFQAHMERYYQDNRTYAAVGSIVPPCDANIPVAQRTQNGFVISCADAGTPDANGYVLSATGTGTLSGFTYTVNQNGEKATPAAGADGWNTSTSCWTLKKGQTC